MNIEPAPSWLSTSKTPPCPLVTMSYAKLSPKPVPCPVGLVVKKGWKILDCTSSGIPVPLSLTEISIAPPALRESDPNGGVMYLVETVTKGVFFVPPLGGGGVGLGGGPLLLQGAFD